MPPRTLHRVRSAKRLRHRTRPYGRAAWRRTSSATTNSVAARPARATKRAIGGSGALTSARRASLSPKCPAADKVAGCSAARRKRRRLERIISDDPICPGWLWAPRTPSGGDEEARWLAATVEAQCDRIVAGQRGLPVTLQPQARARFEGPGGCGARWGNDAAARTREPLISDQVLLVRVVRGPPI